MSLALKVSCFYGTILKDFIYILLLTSSGCNCLSVPPLCTNLDPGCECNEDKIDNIAHVVLTCHDIGFKETVPQLSTPRNAPVDLLRFTGNSQIDFIQSEAFENTGIRILVLENLGIQRLAIDAFFAMTRQLSLMQINEPLEKLLLQNNLISTLPEEIFHSVGNLKWLDLSQNQLEKLDTEIFSQNTELIF